MGISTIVQRISAPLLQFGGIGFDLAFDCEVSVQRGTSVEFTERRIGAGASLSDHSFVLPRTFMLEGAVSGIPQPQNIGRPGTDLQALGIDLGFNALAQLFGIQFQDRVRDFETRLDALIRRREELLVTSKVLGRIRAILLDWDATTTGDMGHVGMYRMTLKEVLRAGLTIADAVPEALELNGSGGNVSPGGGGPSVATPQTLEVTP